MEQLNMSNRLISIFLKTTTVNAFLIFPRKVSGGVVFYKNSVSRAKFIERCTATEIIRPKILQNLQDTCS